MFDYIKKVQNIIKEENIITFNELIEILNEIPLKYMKIVKLDDETNEIKGENNNIIVFNEEIINSKFRLDYAFPFIKYIFARLDFDLEVIDLKNFTQSCYGIILEKLIKKLFLLIKFMGNSIIAKFILLPILIKLI